MSFATPELALEVSRLVADPGVRASLSQEEAQVSAQFDALVIDSSWWYYLLRPNGEVISYDPPSVEISTTEASLRQALAFAARRYPSLRRFVPPRPPDAGDCYMCAARGVIRSSTGEDGACPVCGGLGWALLGA